MIGLKDKAVLVTGGTRGIGAAIATSFGRAGASVAVAGRSVDDEVKQNLETLRSVSPALLSVVADVANPAAAAETVRKTVERFGRLDFLVHAAGGPAPGRIDQLTVEEWMAAFDIHVHAVFHLFREALPYLGLRGGGVLLISSVAGLRGCPGTVAYQVVKGALPQFVRALARDHAAQQIRVNAVAPGIVRTRFHEAMTEAAKRNNLENRIPLAREGTPEDVAEIAMAVVTNEFMTGETVVVDGGMSMRIV
jgi:NAD(P)-dependent dehydrogenase (short-subunit alcohol dehydrogenase family)